MKKLLFPLLFLTFTFISCDSLSKLTQFEKEFSTSITIPVATTVVNTPITISSPEIKTDITKYLTDNKIDSSLVEKISLKKLQMTINIPDTVTFKFLSFVEISIYTPDSSMVSKIASLTNVQANKTIELKVDNADLKKFILNDAFKLSFKITTNQTIYSDYVVDVKPTILIDANVLEN